MNRTKAIFSFFIILLTTILLLSCSDEDTDFAQVSTTLSDEFPGEISGTVYWRDEPLLGVSVTSGTDGVSTVSGVDGSFILSNLSEGMHDLTFFKAGYLDTTLADPVLVKIKSKTALPNTVSLTSRYSSISGQVIMQNGSLIPMDQFAGIAIEGQANTGVAIGGAFSLDGIEAGTIKIRSVVSGLGFGEIEQLIVPDSVYTGINIKLQGVGGKVSGTILEKGTNGVETPVVGAKVSVISGVLEKTTDSNGEFEIDNVPSTGDVSLTVKKSDGTTSIVVGGIDVQEEGKIDIGNLDLTKDPEDTSALFQIQTGTFRADFATPTSTITLFPPAILKDTAYEIIKYEWDFDADTLWDTVTSSPRLILSKQDHWITAGETYIVRGRSTAVPKTGGEPITSGAGKVKILIQAPNNPAVFDIATAPKDQILTEGQAYTTAIKAIDLDSDPVVYKLEEGPIGLTLDQATGAIAWTAATLGAHKIKVSVTDGKGTTDGYSWKITVPTPVTIDNISGVTTVAAGDAINLSATTTSLLKPVLYTWEVKGAGDELYRVVKSEPVSTGTGSFALTTSAGLKENGATVRLTVDNGTATQSQIWNITVTGIVDNTPFTNMLAATYWYSITDTTGSTATMSGLPTTLKWDVNILASTASWGAVNSGPLTIDGVNKATYETAKNIRIVYRSTDEFALTLPMPEDEQYNWSANGYLLNNTSGAWDSLDITIDAQNFKSLYDEPIAPFNKSNVTTMGINAYDTYPGVQGYIEVRRLDLVGFTGTQFDENTETAVLDSISGVTTVVAGNSLNLTGYANSSVTTPITYTWLLGDAIIQTTPSTTQFEDVLTYSGLTLADNGKTVTLILDNGIVADTLKKVISVISGGTELEKTIVFTGDITMNSLTDTVSQPISATLGNTYTVSQNYKDFEVSYQVLDPTGAVISYGGAFKATQTGSYTYRFYVSWHEIAAPYTKAITIEEYAPLDASLSGMWLLTSEYSSTLGKTYTTTFRADSADEVIEFRNDSLIRYTFDVNNSNINSYGQLFAGHWYSSLKISNDGTTLTFTSSGAEGASVYTYTKYTAPLSSITWQEQVFNVPSNAIGSWYRSSENWNYYEFGIQDSNSNTYASGALSDRIVVITADSVISFSNEGFQVRREASLAAGLSWWNYGTMINGEFHLDYVEYEDNVEYGYESEVYTSYSGTVPPTEWNSLTIPATSTTIASNQTLPATLSGDTLWYNLAVTAGSEYTCTIRNTDYTVYMAIVAADGTIQNINPANLGNWDISKTFTSNTTGNYYLAITGASSTVSNIDVSVTTSSTQTPSVILDNFQKNVLLKNNTIYETDYTSQSYLGYQFGGYVDITYDSLGWGGGHWYAFASDNGVVIQSEDQGDASTIVVAGDQQASIDSDMSKLFRNSQLYAVFDATNITDTNSYWAGIAVSLPGDPNHSKDHTGTLWDGLSYFPDALEYGSPTEQYCWNLENLESITVKGSVALGDIKLFIRGVNSVTNTVGTAVIPLVGGEGPIELEDISRTITMSEFQASSWNGQDWIDIRNNVISLSLELNTDNSDKTILELDHIIFNFTDEASKNSAFPFLAQ